jgi:hypothetical protein
VTAPVVADTAVVSVSSDFSALLDVFPPANGWV